MEFGIFILMQQRGYHQTSADVMHTAWSRPCSPTRQVSTRPGTPEHHFSNYGLCPSPLMMVAHMAALTKRIRLGSAVCILPMYHPVRLLAEAGFADTVSNGRLEFGVGSGYQKFEFDRFGVNIEDAPAIFNEFLDIIQLGLTAEGFSTKESTCSCRRPRSPPLGAEADAADLADLGPPGGPGTRRPRRPQPLRHGPAQRYRQLMTNARGAHKVAAREGRDLDDTKFGLLRCAFAATTTPRSSLPRQRALPAAGSPRPEVPPRPFRRWLHGERGGEPERP